MLAARRLQNSCPQCTAQILRLYVHSIAEIAPAAATQSTRQILARSRLRTRRTSARFLSTSSRRLLDEPRQDASNNAEPDPLPDELAQSMAAESSDGLPEPLQEELETPLKKTVAEKFNELPETQDPEKIVRQAKRMFGDTLPVGYLSEDEYKLYERLYGAPLRQTQPGDVGFGSFGEFDEEDVKEVKQNTLLKEIEEGLLEEVEYTAEPAPAAEGAEAVPEEIILETRPPSDAQLDFIEAHVNNQREYAALLQLQQDFEAARIRAEQEEAEMERELAAEEEEEEEQEEVEEEEEEEKDTEPDANFLDWYPGHEGARIHKHTVEGWFRTFPSTLYLPNVDFVRPISELLKRTDTKHILGAAESTCGGPGLPNSPATPRFARNRPQKGLGLEAIQPKMSEIDADAFLATALPGIYASVTSVLVEVRKRLGPDWLRGLLNRKEGNDAGPRVLDAGAGGAGLCAWQKIIQAEWDVMREKDSELAAVPPGKRTVIVGSNNLRHRLSRFLENTQFLPRLPNYAHIDNSDKQLDAPEVPQKRKVYDVIIAPHMLMPLDREWRRKETLDNLWSMLSPDGGVLIVLEKGHPRGFEAVADVRQRLLDEFIISPSQQPNQETNEPDPEARVREPGMIVAPCTNHSKCPMYLVPGISPGRKDFCHFSQRFVRPPFLQRILGAKHVNHEDINFSFIAVRRGMPAANATASASESVEAEASPSTTEQDSSIFPLKTFLQGEQATKAAFAGYESAPSSDSSAHPHPLSLPRSILPPLKRKGHVTLDLCTPSGSIERWTIPRSFSKQAYRDARKSRWGDLWALGAKTRVRRPIRLGRGMLEGERVPDDGGVRAARMAALNGTADGKKARRKPRVVEIGLNAKGVWAEKPTGLQSRRPERRTKGGRLPPRERKSMRDEDDLSDG